jgi:hypothetical protein
LLEGDVKTQAEATAANAAAHGAVLGELKKLFDQFAENQKKVSESNNNRFKQQQDEIDRLTRSQTKLIRVIKLLRHQLNTLVAQFHDDGVMMAELQDAVNESGQRRTRNVRDNPRLYRFTIHADEEKFHEDVKANTNLDVNFDFHTHTKKLDKASKH